jgi:hypothetical protein
MLDDPGRDRMLALWDAVLWLAIGFLVGGAFVGWYGVAAPCN